MECSWTVQGRGSAQPAQLFLVEFACAAARQSVWLQAPGSLGRCKSGGPRRPCCLSSLLPLKDWVGESGVMPVVSGEGVLPLLVGRLAVTELLLGCHNVRSPASSKAQDAPVPPPQG